MRLTKFVKFREEKFGGVLFETRSEKGFALNPTAAAVLREVGGRGGRAGDRGGRRRGCDRGAAHRQLRRSQRSDRARSPHLHRGAARARAPRWLTAWPISQLALRLRLPGRRAFRRPPRRRTW